MIKTQMYNNLFGHLFVRIYFSFYWLSDSTLFPSQPIQQYLSNIRVQLPSELEENTCSCRNVGGSRKEDKPHESQQPPGFIHPSRKNASLLQESVSPFLSTSQDAGGLFSVLIIISLLLWIMPYKWEHDGWAMFSLRSQSFSKCELLTQEHVFMLGFNISSL